MKRKIFTAPLELKQDGEPGEFRAVFATLNVMDLDEDVTPPGAFSEQPVIVEPWNHQWTLPAGKGVVKADDKEAWIEGRFFLDTDVGQENYQTVKNLGDLAEWSYTFDILEADSGVFEGNQVRFLRRMDVVGVSPVSRGAGIDTRTVAIKTDRQGVYNHLARHLRDADVEPPELKSVSEDEADAHGQVSDGKSSDLNTLINLAEIGLIVRRMEIES